MARTTGTTGTRTTPGAQAAAGRDLNALAGELADPNRALRLPDGEAPEGVKRAFASSYTALPPDSQRLFAALAAFATPEFGRRAALAMAEALHLTDPETALNTLVLRAGRCRPKRQHAAEQRPRAAAAPSSAARLCRAAIG